MGAWIEILIIASPTTSGLVAPIVGAWIEMPEQCYKNLVSMVAPIVGAWIEIKLYITNNCQALCYCIVKIFKTVTKTLI